MTFGSRCLVAIAGMASCLALLGESQASPAANLPHQPKIALDSRAVARAKRITVQLRDLPAGRFPSLWLPNAQWKPGLVNKVGPTLACHGHAADLSSVTFVGGWSSRFDRIDATRIWELSSGVMMLASPSQARLSFDDTNLWLTRYCFVRGSTAGADRFTSVRRAQPPPVADERAEVLIRKVSTRVPGRKLGSVIVLLRCGRIVIELTFDWARKPIPTSLIESIVRRIAARAR